MLLKTIKRQVKKHLGPYINPDVVIFLRKYADMAEINFNAALGRHFLPHPRRIIMIETSGICNLSCRFCAYPKKERGKVVMPMTLFQEVVNQAADMGFSAINITPQLGDGFMDKTLLEKMQYLDNHPKIKRYDFFTNFVVPSEQKIKELFKLRKLNILRVSVYGHDEKSFCDLTQATKKEYHRLVRNLKCLYKLYDQNRSFQLDLQGRTVSSFSSFSGKSSRSELQEIMLNFEKTHQVVCEGIFQYHSMVGKVTNEDVKGLGLRINDGSNIYKKGFCSRLMTSSGVLADGRVDACLCRDVIDGSLVVGNVKKEPLSYILSLNNPLYADIIQEQIEGKLRPVCKNCDYYHSIYKPEVRWGSFKTYHLNQMKALLSK
jgi:MoaA/NifB/PqqE/SkfB family radical SAM enzyme